MTEKPIRVLYSFPHKLGADRICTTAWQQVAGLAAAGVEVLACPGALSRLLPAGVTVRPTLSRGRFRIPYKAIGSMRAFLLHDYIVSQRMEKLAGQIDIIHTWPLGALRTLKTAAKLGIPTVLERPNAHTQFAYEVVRKECEKLGLTLPSNHEHAYKSDVLERELEEYEWASRLLCPSDFVASTFLERGFARERLARHQYGFDETIFSTEAKQKTGRSGLTMLFVGGCAPRKGLHYALEAWLKSSACHDGEFLIAGAFVTGYAEKLAPLLSHSSVRQLGHRSDVADLMRQSDVLVLPSIEEGSALVTSEARGCGCVLLVSDAAGAVCAHGENALVHHAGDVQALTAHINSLQQDRGLLEKLRNASLKTVDQITWTAAGRSLLDVYRETLAMRSGRAHKTAEPVPSGEFVSV